MPVSVYVCSVEGAPVRVELEQETARKLREAAAAGRREEIGGFLLGTMEEGVTRITGFQLVECEHRRGEAYDLTPLDRLRFSRRCAPWLNKRPHETRAVGFFRTHLRPGLFLDEHDFRTVQEFFADPRQVVLLARPEAAGSPVAGLFFWESGEMERSKSYRPFPLDEAVAGATVGAAPAGSEAETPKPQPVAVIPSSPATPSATVPGAVVPGAVVPIRSAPVARPRDAAGWKYGLVAVCIPLAAGLAYYAGRHEKPRTPRPAPAAAVTEADTQQTTPSATPIPMAAAPAPIAQFPMAVKKSPMDTPAGAARANRGRPGEEEPDWTATPPRAYHQANLSGQGVHPGVTVVNPRPEPAVPAEARNTAAEPAQGTEVAKLEKPAAPMPQPEASAPPPAQRFRPELHPAITVESEDPSSGLGHKLVRLPKRILTLGIAGRGGYVPPRPLHEVAPSVPARVAQELTGVVPITVRISVDPEGKVRGTELLTGAADPQLADLALNAARKWEFIAARHNDTPVSSSVIAHFRFRPPLSQPQQ